MSHRARLEAEIAAAMATAKKELFMADLEDKVIAMATGAEPIPWKEMVEETDFVRSIYYIMEECYANHDEVFDEEECKLIGKLHSDAWLRFVLYVFQYMKTKGYLDGDNSYWEDTASGCDEVIQDYMLEALKTYE
jgi:hypothetical protein